jgi:hypothetical protein
MKFCDSPGKALAGQLGQGLANSSILHLAGSALAVRSSIRLTVVWAADGADDDFDAEVSDRIQTIRLPL